MPFPFENKIKSILDGQPLFEPGDRILVAVSGGMDSMCLISLLHALNLEIVAGHVNFKLRGEESDLDEALVRSYCASLGLPVHSVSFDTRAQAKKSRQGIQETARNLRYAWLNELADHHGYQKIATAHHRDDQAETLIHNLVRGAGLRGAGGIPVRQGRIIRPLLTVSKTEIRDYITIRGIPYREDHSNLKTDYTRNKIRHQIIPLLEQINPRASVHLAEFAGRMQDYLPAYILWKNQLSQIHLTKAGSKTVLSVPQPADASLLYVLLEDYGFNASQCAGIARALRESHKGSHFYSELYVLIIIGHQAELQDLSHVNPPVNIEITSLPFETQLENRHIEIKTFPVGDCPDTYTCADLSSIRLPLRLRTWRAGDRFAPSGMDGKSKKVQDFLTDLKVSGFEKKQALVLCDADRIIWVWPGNRIDEMAKCKDKARAYLGIRCRP